MEPAIAEPSPNPQTILIDLLKELYLTASTSNSNPYVLPLCLLCQSPRILIIGSNSYGSLTKSTERKLQESYAQSLCQLLGSKDQDQLEGQGVPKGLMNTLMNAPFCENCYQLVLDIEFLSNGIKAYERRLLSLKHKTENLLYRSGVKIEETVFVDYLETCPDPPEPDNDITINFSDGGNSEAGDDGDDLQENKKRGIGTATGTKSKKVSPAPATALKRKAEPEPKITITRSGRKVSKPKEFDSLDEDDHDPGARIGDEYDNDDEFMEADSDCHSSSDGGSDVEIIEKKSRPQPRTKLEKMNKKLSFHCDQCPAVYMKQSRLETHIQRDHLKSEPQVKCLLCGKLFWSQENLTDHYRQKHKAMDLEGCNVVEDLPPAIVKSLKQKTSKTSRLRRIKCDFDDQCTVYFSHRQRLLGHIQKDHLKVEPKVPCLLCDKKFYSKLSLRDHYRYGHKEDDIGTVELPPEITNLVQQRLKRKPKNSSKDKASIKRKDGQKSINLTCETCEKTLSSMKSLQMHMESVHAEILNKPNCSVCGKIYDSPDELIQHEHLHQLALIPFNHPWSCVLCTNNAELYQTKTDLEKHVLSTHEPNVFRCTECPYVAITRPRLSQHIKVYHKQSWQICELCGYKAASPSRLRDHHTLKHLTERPFQCEVEGCGSTFKTPKCLNTHAKEIHDEVSRLSNICPICFKIFSNKRNLRKHAIYHSNVRPFVCELCSAACKTMNDLDKHLKNHEKNPNLKIRKPVNRLFGPEEDESTPGRRKKRVRAKKGVGNKNQVKT